MSLTKPNKNKNVLAAVSSALDSSPTIAIAVSGGADSMALLLMAHDSGHKVIALTVDHGLRKASKAEAFQVKQWCGARRIEHHTLTWDAPKKNQADARDARYRLLTDWCKKHQVQHLMTAHHRGDQAETLFFRLARGSNLRGLACISPESEMHGIRMQRPLLHHSKKELIAYLQEHGQSWIEDPSNQTMDYTRNLIRAQLQSLPNADDIEERAAKVAEAFGRIRAMLDSKTDAAFAQVVTLHNGSAIIHAQHYKDVPSETSLLLTAHLIKQLTGDAYPPRTEKLERLQRWLLSPDGTSATLAHLEFTYDANKGQFIVTAAKPLNTRPSAPI